MIEIQITPKRPRIGIEMGRKKGNIDIDAHGMFFEKDYNKLINKPQLNGVTLIGNTAIEDIFADGVIIDGGSAEEVNS